MKKAHRFDEPFFGIFREEAYQEDFFNPGISPSWAIWRITIREIMNLR